MKLNRSPEKKSMTSEYLVALAELNNLESEEPDDEILLPMDTEAIFEAKSAIDEVLSRYEMTSTAVVDGIIIHEAKSIGPVLANELIGALADVSVKALGPTLAGAAGGGSAEDMIDRDGDGYIYDGTPQEQRVPYKRRDGKPVGGGTPEGMEARRRQFVRSEAARQGVQLNRGPNRSESERRFRTEARARFDRIALEGQGFIPADRIEAGDKRNFENRMGDVNAGRVDDQGRSGFGYGGERDTSFEDNENRRQQGLRDTSFEDNEERRQEGMRPEDTSSQRAEDARNRGKRPQRPVDRLGGAGGPGYDESFNRNETRRQQGMRPADTSNQRAEDARQGAARPQRPVDRLGGAGGPGYDESSNRAESARMQGLRPADTSSQRAETARQGIARPNRPVDRLGGAGGPGYDESSNRNEQRRMQGMRPADTSSQRAETARQGASRPQKPVDRIAARGYDESSSRAESARMERSRPADTSSQAAESSRQNRSRPQRPADRLSGSGSRRVDGSSNAAEASRMNRSRPADRSSERNESARQTRNARNTRELQKRPPDRINTAGTRPRRFPRGANDYYYGGDA